MSEQTQFDPFNETGRVATTVHEDERPTHSRVLGPNGEPLRYERHRIGFYLRPPAKNAQSDG